MSDETRKALEQFALQIVDAAKAGGQWTTEQAPLLVQEWLRWQLAEAVIFMVMFTSIATALGLFSKYCWKQYEEGYHYNDWNISGTFLAIGCGVFALLTFVPLLQVVKVLVAPRVVVLEKFMELVR